MSCNCEEEWTEIKNYPNYQISSKGRVWTCNRKRLMKTNWNMKDKTGGYLFIGLRDKTGKHSINIHRLVIEHYGLRKPDNCQCDHKNKDKSNNCICNLRWITFSENMKCRKSRAGVITIKRKKGYSYVIQTSFNSVKKNITFKDKEEADIFKDCYNCIKDITTSI